MSWRALRRVHALYKANPEQVSQAIKDAVEQDLRTFAKPADLVVYERGDAAIIGMVLGCEGDRYLIRDPRIHETIWVGIEALLHHGKPQTEWFAGQPSDHQALFSPIYLAADFDELVAAWESLDAELDRKGEQWRLASELKRTWVPRWGRWSEEEIGGGVRGVEHQTIISWETNSSPSRILMFNSTALSSSVGTLRS